MKSDKTKQKFLFEHFHEPVISSQQFVLRFFRSILIALVIITFSLGLGVAGYHFFCHLNWIDSLLNASMILTGMGQINLIENNGGKIFASIYALFSGIAFLTTVAVLIAPVIHRFMHKFHLEEESGGK